MMVHDAAAVLLLMHLAEFVRVLTTAAARCFLVGIGRGAALLSPWKLRHQLLLVAVAQNFGVSLRGPTSHLREVGPGCIVRLEV